MCPRSAVPATVDKPAPAAAFVGLALLVLGATGCPVAGWAAGAMIHPGKSPPAHQPARPFEIVDLQGAGVRLKGWRFHGEGPARRGTVVYLHGIGDNRGSSIGIANHFVPLGYDVLAYDSRAHGESGGEACTFGVYEKQDLLQVLATIEARPIILLGNSLGAATALQAAAQTKLVGAVVSISTFSDLRTVARHRAPFFLSNGTIEDAFHQAERDGHFRVDDASPLAAAPAITAPTLMIHGAKDDETPPDESQRVYEALRAPKHFILVPGANHNNVFGRTLWPQIDEWLRATFAS
jgi:alpha-beta hydrolase superfamily lysophospholipase